jgi:hypothetical protein
MKRCRPREGGRIGRIRERLGEPIKGFSLKALPGGPAAASQTNVDRQKFNTLKSHNFICTYQ